jgi:hypothetical protein
MDIYTQAVPAPKRKAQAKVVELIAPKKALSQGDPLNVTCSYMKRLRQIGLKCFEKFGVPDGI